MKNVFVDMRNRQQSFEHLKQYSLNRNKFGPQSEHTGLSDSQIQAPSGLSRVPRMGLHGQEQFH